MNSDAYTYQSYFIEYYATKHIFTSKNLAFVFGKSEYPSGEISKFFDMAILTLRENVDSHSQQKLNVFKDNFD